MKKRISLYLILLFTIAGCDYKPPLPSDFSLSKKLIYIEDRDGEGGLMSFDFGDVIVLDPTTGTKLAITADKYFDRHAVWFRLDSMIVFESRRIGSQNGIYDLSTPSHIFAFDINKGKIVQLDKEWANFGIGLHVDDVNCYPTVAAEHRWIAFGKSVSFCCQVVQVLDLVSKTAKTISDTVDLIGGIRWSPTDKYVAFTYRAGEDIRDHSVAIQIRDVITGELKKEIYKRGWIYGLGSFKDNNLVFTGHEIKSGFTTSLFMYNIDSNHISNVYEFENINVASPVFGSEGVFFLGMKEQTNGYESDVYWINLHNREIKRITTDAKQKMDLFFCN